MLDIVLSEDILILICESPYKVDRIRPDSELIDSWILPLYPCYQFTGKSHITRVVDDREEYVDGGWMVHLNIVYLQLYLFFIIYKLCTDISQGASSPSMA
jgi:hypothetical protein